MVGVEIDFCVTDSLSALALYEHIFDAYRVEATSYQPGMNEAVFTIYGTRFHILDENPQYQLVAPKPDDPRPMWMNIFVPDINDTYARAISAGCQALQPVTELEAMGVSNAIFADPFGYVWMLQQIHREVSFDERCRVMEGLAENGTEQ